MISPFRLILISLAASTLLASPGFANWPGDSNTSVPICISADNQGEFESIPDGAGGAIIAWDDQRSGSGLYDVYAQRVNAYGKVLWTTNGVGVCVRDSIQALPFLVSDGAGGAIITWTDGRSGNYDVYAQRVSAAGVPQWTVNGVAVAATTGDQIAQSILSDGAGGAIIAFADTRSGNENIYAQRVNASGVAQWTGNGVLLCGAVGDQYGPLLVSDGAGGAVAVWQDDRAGSTNSDIYVRAINAAGTPQWTADGVALCTAVGIQSQPQIVSDGSGGAIVTWDDARAGSFNHDIYAGRINSLGGVSWTANGVGVCTLNSPQYSPLIATDGAGGAIVSWRDDRSTTAIFAQRLSASGSALWTANGITVCNVAQSVTITPNAMTSDGAGGTVISWNDYRAGPSSTDIYSQRLSASGSPLWTLNGLAISTVSGSQENPSLVLDSVGGVIYFWQDFRSGFADIYAARTDPTGLLGVPAPIIDAVRDVANDQGGKVEVLWEPSSLDIGSPSPIDSYNLWRRVVTTTATRPQSESGSLRTLRNSTNSTYWEFVASVPARGAPGYALMVTTGSDSLPGSIPWNDFFVEAKKGTTYYTSLVDSGYSVDNLSPATPAAFIGNVAAGATHLHWDRNGESDLYGYRVYRGTSASFAPDPGNRIAAPSDTGYTDAAVGYYYKLSAVDVHGNESSYALVTPQQTTDAGSTPAITSLALLGANPAHGSASLRYTLSREGEARLVVFDPAGRVVKLLAAGQQQSGDHQVRWDGRADSGHALASGLYFARLVSSDVVREVRFVLLR